MTVPRHEIFDPSTIGVYHCISRCVRRAFLCGYDLATKTSYEHRRLWARNRLAFLGNLFAMDLISFAIMGNHFHMLIRNRPDVATAWSDEEVARRWRTLFPIHHGGKSRLEPTVSEIRAITSNPDLVRIYRERLSSISWFNRCFAEYIARRANREDECTGRFWEGRFISKKILDLKALIACSVYIDLNPIRSGMAKTPEDSDYTSIQQRIRTRRSDFISHPSPTLISIADISASLVTDSDYLMLVDQTGRVFVDGKGRIPESLKPILDRIKIAPNSWVTSATSLESRFKRVVGPLNPILDAAAKIGKRWFQGLGSAQEIFGIQ